MNTGDPCLVIGCNGNLKVYKTEVIESAKCRRRFLRCNTCKHVPDDNVIAIPLQYAPRRPRRPRIEQRRIL